MKALYKSKPAPFTTWKKEEIVSQGLLTIAEAAQWLRASRSYVYKLVRSGQLMFVKIGGNIRIPQGALWGLAAENLQVADKENL